MANYSPNAKSLINGLSDFWLQYFKELPVIEEIYRGMEIEVGQSYLDLMALLLNNSVQDATIFNKNFFKMLRLREDSVVYSADGTYSIALEQNVASVKYLNNKIFAVTAALEGGVDFQFDTASRSLLFPYDPFSAYYQAAYGAGNSAFDIATATPGPTPGVTIELLDDGSADITVTRAVDAITVAYSGPLNGSIHTANALIAQINSTASVGLALRARLSGLSSGAESPAGSPAKLLTRVSRSPLANFAVRESEVLFGTKFTDPGRSSWSSLDIQKGDILRITYGENYGNPQEFPIALVREDGLYLYPEAAPEDISGGLEYTVLRSPMDATSVGEPAPVFGTELDPGLLGVINGAARTITLLVPSPTPSAVLGDVIVLRGTANAGEYRIVQALSPTVYVLAGNPLFDEVDVPYSFVTSASLSTLQLGTATAESGGFATFTGGGAFFSASTVAGTYIRWVVGTTVSYFPIAAYVSPTQVSIEVPAGFVGGVQPSAWINVRAAEFAVTYAAPTGYLVPGTVEITARRVQDGAVVAEGRDYTVDYTLGIVRPLTVWQASVVSTVTYAYRLSVLRDDTVISGFVGTLAAGVTNTLTDPTANFSNVKPGYVLKIRNSLSGNNGRFYVTAVLSPTQLELAGSRTPLLPEGNNGSLRWRVHRGGRAQVTDVYERVNELGVWAVDAKIDEYHLYFTYGYLVNRVAPKPSSEAYRALIRGLFQLFMLGPTLERFESAINTVAGLEVIRDDGELLLSYFSGASRSGTDGDLNGSTRVFTSATAAFVPGDLSNKLYVADGTNANKLFTILAVLGPTQVELAETPTSQALASWEITATGTHGIVTSRATYTYPRVAPLKPKYLAAGNWGVLELRAFEVVTAAFEVTDYVETPYWWESARIPAVLAPDYTPQRRQSTPVLFENVVGAPDGPCVGDPGLFVGADDTGYVIPQTVLQSGLGDGVIYADPHYPASTTETFFESPTAAFVDNDVGNYVRVPFPAADSEYRITARISATRVKVESFTPFPYPSLGSLDWEVLTGTLPLRHTAAYVVLDRFMKHHLFSVRFDAYLLERLDSDVIQDLQRLVFEAKPTYTYLLLTPASLFEDVIRIVDEDIDINGSINLGGSAGMLVVSNVNDLLVSDNVGVGSWFRPIEASGSFSSGPTTIANILGVPDAGFRHIISKVYIDPAAFIIGGLPVGYDRVTASLLDGGVDGEFSVDGDGNVTFSSPTINLTGASLLGGIIIGGASNPGNDGEYRIGSVLSATEAHISNGGTAVSETGLMWIYGGFGGYNGTTSTSAEGESFFSGGGTVDFLAAGVGTFVRRVFVGNNLEQTFRVDEVFDLDNVRLATRTSVLPTPGYTSPYVAAVSGSILTVTPGDFIFDPDMMYLNRRAADVSTAKRVEYLVEFLSGPNSGEVRTLSSYTSPNTAALSGAPLVADPAADIVITCRTHYVVGNAGGAWEHLTREVVADNISYPAVPSDTLEILAYTDTLTINYTAYGVRVPIDPTVETFDAEQGDTYYTVGGLNPCIPYMRTRSGRDMDMQEWPITVIVTESDGGVGGALALGLGG